MCRTYNSIGCLNALKSHLQENNILDFKSLGEVIEFQKSYQILRDQLISIHKDIIERERYLLGLELPQLENAIDSIKLKFTQRLDGDMQNLKRRFISSDHDPKNIYQKITRFYRIWLYKRKIKHCKIRLESELKRSISDLKRSYQFKSDRFKFVSCKFDEAVNQSLHYPLIELDRKKKIIDESNNLIYGALGEQKVVKVLETISDDYYLINYF